jgi:hypothetical protein
MKRFVCDYCGSLYRIYDEDILTNENCLECNFGKLKRWEEANLTAAAVNRLNETIQDLIKAIEEK